MNPTTASADPGSASGARPKPFPHLRALRAAYDELLTRWAQTSEPKSANFWDEVRSFIDQACATGAVLNDDSDRFAAGRLITYWVNVLCREGLSLPARTTLVEFSEAATVILADSARPYITRDEFEGASANLVGWKRLIRDCLQRLDKHHLAAVVGPSGSGRRTLITSGVLPELSKGALTRSQEWRLLTPVAPGSKPLAELVATVSPQANLDIALALVRRDPTHLARLLDQEGGTAVVIIDQFEALFATLERDDIKPFIEALLAVLKGRRHFVLLALRSDALPQVAAFEELAREVQSGQVFLMFTNRELRQAIEEPAQQVGLVFDPGVVDWLINDVQGDPAVAPLLQFSLLQLWENRAGNRITRETYERLRGGRVALQRVAERVYEQIKQDGYEDVVQ
jgi:hypothetical protein